MRRTTIAFVLAIALPARAQHDSGDQSAISATLAAQPIYCATTLPDRQLCTWREDRTFHVVCELDMAGKRTPAPCVRQPDNVAMWTFPQASLKHPRRAGVPSRAMLIDAARVELEDARSLEQVVALVGAGPVWCYRSDVMTCSWHAVRRTPGYMRLSRIADAPGKKVNVRCAFHLDGSSREPGSCSVVISGRAEKPT